MAQKANQKPQSVSKQMLDRIYQLTNDYLVEAEREFVQNGLTSRHLLFALQDINLKKLLQLLNERWDDPVVTDGMHSIFSALQVLNRQIPSPQVYRYYMKILAVLGSGVQGEAISATIKTPGKYQNYGGIVAVKTYVPGQFEDAVSGIASIQREFFACRQLEKLNYPIFLRAYGIMNCTGSYQKDSSGDLGFCANDLPVSIITQFIQGSPIDKITISATDFYKCFLIFLFGLQKAKSVQLTHHDPHFGNVLYRKLPATWAIPVANGKFISTNIIPVVLDYGLARVDTPQGPIYAEGTIWESNGITSRYAPLHDVYKFFMWVIYQRMDWFRTFKFVIDFFHKNLTSWGFTELRKRNYIVPSQFRSVPLDTFIKYLENNAPPQFQMSNFLSTNAGKNHIYGIYSNKINFFNEIGIDLDKFATLSDSFQWYMYRATKQILDRWKRNEQTDEDMKLVKDLMRILPNQQRKLIEMIDDAVKIQIPEISNKYRQVRKDVDQIRHLGYVGDIAWSVKNEMKTIILAINDMIAIGKLDRKEMEPYRVQLSQKAHVLQQQLDYFLGAYQYYQRESRKNYIYEKMTRSIYPPSIRA